MENKKSLADMASALAKVFRVSSGDTYKLLRLLQLLGREIARMEQLKAETAVSASTELTAEFAKVAGSVRWIQQDIDRIHRRHVELAEGR